MRPDRHTDKQTYWHADRNTWHTYHGQVNISEILVRDLPTSVSEYSPLSKLPTRTEAPRSTADNIALEKPPPLTERAQA